MDSSAGVAAGKADAPIPKEAVPPREQPAPSDSSKPPPKLVQASENFREIMRLQEEARSALKSGDSKAAEAALDKILTLRAEDAYAVVTKAGLARKDGRLEEALKVLDTGLAKNPGNASFLLEKAKTLVEAGEDTGAMATLEEARRLGHASPHARYLRASLLAKGGDRDGTIAAIRDAMDHGFTDESILERDPNFRSVEGDKEFQAIVQSLAARRVAAAANVSLPPPQTTVPSKLPEAKESLPATDLLDELRTRLASSKPEDVAFTGETVDGKPVNLTDYLGKVLIVELWSTWSRSSHLELPILTRLKKEFGAQGLEVLGLAWEHPLDRQAVLDCLRAYQKDFGLEFPNVLVEAKDLPPLRVALSPTTIFIGRNGKVYLRASGPKSYETIRSIVEMLLAAPTPAPPMTTPQAPKAPGGAPSPGTNPPAPKE